MNISQIFAPYHFSLFKEPLLSTLTAQQKRVLMVASVAFSILAACYLIGRCCFKATACENEQLGDAQYFTPKNVKTPKKVHFKEEVSLESDATIESLETSMDLTGRLNVSDQVILNLPKNLKILSLARCKNLTDQALKQLSTHLTHLKELNLYGCTSLTDDGIKFLKEIELEKLNLSSCVGLTDVAIQYLSPNLKELHLSGCSCMDRSQKIIDALPQQIQKLHLSRFYLTDEMIKRLPKSLIELTIDECWCVQGRTFDHLSKNLRKLNTSSCGQLTDQAIGMLSDDLEELILEDCVNLTDAALEKLPTKLLKLNVQGCHRLTEEAIQQLSENIKVEKSNFLEKMLTPIRIKLRNQMGN